MKKKLLALGALVALCLLSFATDTDNMFVKLKDGKIFEFTVENVEEVYFGAPTKRDTIVEEEPAYSFEFRVLSDSTVKVIGYKPLPFDPQIVVPSTVKIEGKRYTVTSISERLINGYNVITGLQIPSSVTNIGELAFAQCTDLDVVIENSSDNVKIGDYAFFGCKSVTFTEDAISADSSAINALLLPFKFNILSDSTVEVAGYYQFMDIDSLQIPSKVILGGKSRLVTALGEMSLYGCGCSYVYLPNSVTEIKTGALESTKNLKNIVIPSSVTSIDDNAFRFSALTSVEFPDYILIGREAFYMCSNLESVNIPSKAIIDQSAFEDCDGIKELTIQPGVTHIGKRSFGKCTSLTNLFIPSSVKSFGLGAFWGCSKLEAVVDNPKDSIQFATEMGSDILDDPFDGCKSVTYKNESIVVDAADVPFTFEVLTDSTVEVITYSPAEFKTEADIPSKVKIDGKEYTVTKIGREAFASNYLTSISIPSTVTTIGINAFNSCQMLTNVVIPSSVTHIEAWAFSMCPDLINVELPENVFIDYEAFYGCSSLKSLVLPSGASTGHNSFMACSGLTSLEIEQGVESIGKHAFMECTSLTNVFIPSSVKSFGLGAFWGCSKLEAVVDNPKDSIQFATEMGSDIPDNPFDGCKSVTYKE